MVPITYYLWLAALLFTVGLAGVLLKRNALIVMMSVELMLNAANLTFLAASRQHSSPEHTNLVGPVFAIFVIAGFAETNRLPFDLPEAEAELVAGYHTEYSSMKFAMFFMAEYINMITSSALCVTLFLGGYQLGFPVPFEGWTLWVLQILAFVGKVAFFQFVFVWVRWTLPRFRYDQLMFLGWKRLIPLSLVNLAVVATLVALGVAPFVKK